MNLISLADERKKRREAILTYKLETLFLFADTMLVFVFLYRYLRGE